MYIHEAPATSPQAMLYDSSSDLGDSCRVMGSWALYLSLLFPIYGIGHGAVILGGTLNSFDTVAAISPKPNGPLKVILWWAFSTTFPIVLSSDEKSYASELFCNGNVA
jgi:hypothetical protein